MKVMLKDVLYVGPEMRTYDGKTYYRIKFVDDKGLYDALEVNVDVDVLATLPAPRTRVDVDLDLVQRNGRTYLQKPELKPLQTSKTA